MIIIGVNMRKAIIQQHFPIPHLSGARQAVCFFPKTYNKPDGVVSISAIGNCETNSCSYSISTIISSEQKSLLAWSNMVFNFVLVSL